MFDVEIFNILRDKNVLFSRDGTKQYRDGEAMSPVWIVYLIAQIAEQTDKVRVLQAEGDKDRVLSFILRYMKSV